MKPADLRSRFRGTLLGLALGDALGAPVEGMPPGEYKIPATDILRYTDDTEMMINLSECLVECQDFTPENVADYYLKNLNPSRGYGPGALKTLSLIKEGVPIKEANRKVFLEGSIGNGAAMRVAPVGLAYRNVAPEDLKNSVDIASLPTHAHPVSREGAFIIAFTISLVIKGLIHAEILHVIEAHLTQPLLIDKIKTLKNMLTNSPHKKEVIKRLGNGVFTNESVPTALYAFLKYGQDFLEMIRFTISLGGDTDTISAMAGALSGALVGEEGLPAGFLKKLEDADKIRQLADGLLDRFPQ